MPKLTGLTVEEARDHADVLEAGFQIVEGGTTESSLPAGQIVSQDPEGGRNAAAGATITVTLSDGSGAQSEEKLMPDLLNRDKRIAVSQLEQLGYSEEEGTLIIREEPSDDVNKDYVISTDPAAKTDLEGVSTVTLVVSTGPEEEPVTVIPFVGMTEAEALDKAENELGLVVASIDGEYSATVEEGKICWQSIEAGKQVEKGQTIRFKVSKGPDPASQPSGGESTPPETSEEPVQTPASQLKTINYTVNLPQDRETVEVVVTVDGQEQYRNTLPAVQQLVVIQLKGSGEQTVNVYFDGELSSTRSYNFG